MRYLAIDPGQKHIGVAVSDPTGLIARPLTTLTHEARARDAERLVAIAQEQAVDVILIGAAYGANGDAGPAARHAQRLADALRALTNLPILLHDEGNSTRNAQMLMLEAGRKRRARREHIHAVSAAAILQSFLDAHPRETPPGE
jgi:putative Holliday junction resolvase